MKISKKIVLNIIGLILLTNLVAIFIISNSTPKIFWDYLYKEKNKEIVTIKNSIIKNLKPNNTFDPKYIEHLQRHADVQNLFIEVRNKNKIIYSSGKDHIQDYNLNKLEKTTEMTKNTDQAEQIGKNGKYVEKDFKLFDNRDILLEIGYYENNTLEETIGLFSGKVVMLTFFSILFSIVIGIIASIFVSKQLSKPISKLNDNAKLMSQGEYSNINLVKTKITEIDELSQSIMDLSKNIESQENIRRDMVQNLAHDIRTPLTVLKSHFEAILDGILVLDNKNINILNSEIERLMNLIKKLDDLSESTLKNQNNLKKLMDIKLLNLSNETKNIIDLFYIEAGKSNIIIDYNIEPNIEYKMQKSDYSQLLQNLMSNAIKYNKKNGKVSINLTRSDKDIILEVSDTGIGIEKDKIKYIFERFYRCDTSRSKEVQGNGLGLSIVKELISNMGATIEVESELNRGTKFKICFKEK